jgi:hypothetical protein
MGQTMLAKDTITASLAECFVTIDGNRYNLMQAKSVEIKFEKEKSEIPILGRVGKGNKSNSFKITGDATFYYNTSLFRELFMRYQDTGEDVYFDMQITNDDPTSGAGRQTIIAKDCNLDGGVLAKFDIGSETLEEDASFTVERIEMPEQFKLLVGMI